MGHTADHIGRDAAWAFVGVLLVLAGTATAPPGATGLDTRGYVLAAAGALALALRRSPRLLLLPATACLLAYLLLGYPGVAPAVPVMMGLFLVVRAGWRWVAVGTVAAVLAGGVLGEILTSGAARPVPEVFQRWMLLVGWMVAAAVAGETARQHRVNLEQAQRRAAEAERTREEAARRRADEERLRIARDLHDSLTHSISVIKVQAGVAAHLARRRDEPVPEALVAIERASAEAMRDLRATLEVLRGDGEQVGLDHLDHLLDNARRAGLPVTVTVGGGCRRLPRAVERTAYRVVQESLTNAARHGGGAVEVRLDYHEDGLSIRVADDGPGGGVEAGDAGRGVPGLGLVGMRERVTAIGGALHARPRPGGGFEVRADLPCGSPS